LDDLSVYKEMDQIPLKIADPTKYFQTQSLPSSSTKGDEIHPTHHRPLSAAAKAAVTTELHLVPLDSLKCDAVVKRLDNASKKRKHEDAAANAKAIQQLDGFYDVHSLFVSGNELLRHFWASINLSAHQPEKRAKCERILDALVDLQERANNIPNMNQEITPSHLSSVKKKSIECVIHPLLDSNMKSDLFYQLFRSFNDSLSKAKTRLS
jgi:hypothetical protein